VEVSSAEKTVGRDQQCAAASQIARELAVDAQQSQLWPKGLAMKHGTDTGGTPWETLEQENRRPRRENETLRQEQAFE
jgi:transposase-like protein